MVVVMVMVMVMVRARLTDGNETKARATSGTSASGQLAE